jgi:hypothetical protein
MESTSTTPPTQPDPRWVITIRRLRYLSLRLLQGALGAFEARSGGLERAVSVWPVPSNDLELADVLNRLACALPSGRASIVIPGFAGLPIASVEEDLEGSGHSLHLNEDFLARCEGIEGTSERVRRDGSRIMVWRARALRELGATGLMNGILCDPSYYLAYEPYNYARLEFLLMTAPERATLRAESRHRFAKMRRALSDRTRAHVIVTGPSLTDAVEGGIDTRGSVVIVCNSIVKSREILARLKPDILVFADPVFHFGVSKYAAEFRANAKRTLQDYPNCYCVVPEPFAPLVRGHLGGAGERVIGMPYRTWGSYTIPTEEDFFVKGTDNIMTLLMLPLAYSLAQEVWIAGADGRKKDDRYYWRHNASVQFGDLLGDAFRAHPAFTRDRSYEDYYDRHCSIVERLILHAERARGIATRSLTPSHIPALRSRLAGAR